MHALSRRHTATHARSAALIAAALCVLAACGDDGGPSNTAPAADAGADASSADTSVPDAEPDAEDTPDPLPPIDTLPEQPDLPDLLTARDGTPITTPEQWHAQRRPEIARVLQHYAYGFAPTDDDPVQVEHTETYDDALDGAATLKHVTLRVGPQGGGRIDLMLFVPNARRAPAPVLLGFNFFGNHSVTDDPRVPLAQGWLPSRGVGVRDNSATEEGRGAYTARWPLREAIARGYAVATAYHGDIDPDLDTSTEGVQPLYADRTPAPTWGTLAAWSWGMSRAIDHLTSDPDLDPDRVIAFGHSRNGKVALLTAALDPRVAMTVSNMSGCMGAALSRRRQGESVFIISHGFPHWFTEGFKDFSDREDLLPFDQHHLIALAAPRPALIISGADDAWADPEGEFLGAQAASPAYTLLGAPAFGADAWPDVNTPVTTPLGYVMLPGGHDIGAPHWAAIMDFADLHLGSP